MPDDLGWANSKPMQPLDRRLHCPQEERQHVEHTPSAEAQANPSPRRRSERLRRWFIDPVVPVPPMLFRRLQALAIYEIINGIMLTLLLFQQPEASPAMILSAIVFNSIVYGIARSRWYRWSIWVLLVGQLLLPPVYALFEGLRVFLFLLPSYIFVTLFFSRRIVFSIYLCAVLSMIGVYLYWEYLALQPVGAMTNPESLLLLAHSFSLMLVIIWVQQGDMAQLHTQARDLTQQDAYRHALAQSVPGNVIIVDTNFRIRHIENNAVAPHFRTAIGARLDQLIGEGIWKRVEPTILRAIEQREVTSAVSRLPVPGYEQDWFEHHFAPIIENDFVSGLTIVSFNITERREAEDKLRENEQLLRKLMETIMVGVVVEQGGRIVFHNKMVSIMTGYEARELRQMSLYDLVERDAHDTVRHWLTNAAESPQVSQSEIPLTSKFQRRLWVNFTLTPLDYRGQPAQLVAFVNMTKSVEMQQFILRQERFFRSMVEHSFDATLLINAEGKLQYVSPSVRRVIRAGSEYTIQGRSFLEWAAEYVLPEDMPQIATTLDKLIHQQERHERVRVRLRGGDGRIRWLEGIGTNLLEDDAVRAVVVNARDITQIQQALEAEQKQRRFSDALLGMSAVVNSSLQIDDVLRHILEHLQEVVEHDAANIMLLEHDSAHTVGQHGYAPEAAEILAQSRFQVRELGYLRRMVEYKRPMTIPDTRNDPDWLPLTRDSGLRSYLGAPLVLADEVIGFLNLESEQAGFFQDEHRLRLKLVADLVVMAIKNARAFEQARELAANAERQRIARDLHDAVSQTLFSASMIAETLPVLLEQNLDDVRSGLDELAQLNKGALAEMRTLLVELRPNALQQTDLSVLLAHLVNGMRTRTPAEISLMLAGETLAFPAAVRVNLYRIAQEALNNCIKHAQAAEIYVQLEVSGRSIRLSVGDNGCGFDPDAVSPGHLGLRIMHERASNASIALAIDSRPGDGTQITAHYTRPENGSDS